MLCDSCEKHIGKYETYAGNLWDKTFPHTIQTREIVIKGLNYKQFRLLHLSILWRSSVSTLDTFKHVSLGQKHEENLRQMILKDDPGKPDEYSFFCSMLYLQSKVIYPILQPVKRRLHGFTFYVFYFGGVCWNYCVSAMSFRKFSPTIPIFSEEGTLYFVAEDVMTNPHIDSIFRKGIEKESAVKLRKAFKI